MLGRLLWRRDHNVAALAALDRARTLFRRLHIPTGVLDADDLCASALLDEGRADDAVRVLEASLLVAPSVEGWSVPHTQRRLARALRHAGRVDEALTLARNALEAMEGGHLLLDVAVTRLEEAKCLRALGRATEGLLALAAARAHFDIVGAEPDVVHCDELRARWLHADGRYGEAAEVNARLSGGEDGAVAYEATTRLARDHWAAGEPQLCLDVLDAAADRPSPDRRGPLARAGIRARALLQLERADEARHLAQQALDGGRAGAPPALLCAALRGARVDRHGVPGPPRPCRGPAPRCGRCRPRGVPGPGAPAVVPTRRRGFLGTARTACDAGFNGATDCDCA